MENTRRRRMELDKGKIKFNMGKLFLLGDDCLDHVVECLMDEMHLGVLLLLGLLVTGCIFAHGTGTIDGTIHDDADFLPGL